MKNAGSAPQKKSLDARKQYVRPSCATLSPDQVRAKLGSASPLDQQAQEWIAMSENTQRIGPDKVRKKRAPDGVAKQLRLALAHLSNAQTCSDLSGMLDAMELAYARDCIVVALRDYELNTPESVA
jgi:hypothetical protein